MSDRWTTFRQGEDVSLLAEIVSRVSDGVCLVQASDLTILYANRSLEEMYGYDCGELSGKHVSVLNIGGTADPHTLPASVAAGAQATGAWEGDVLSVRRDGTTLWCNVRVTKWTQPGFGDAFVSVQRDVTARKTAEDALRKTEEKWHMLCVASLDAVLLTAPDGRILSANQAACRMFGRSEEEIVRLGRAGIVDTADPRLALALEERERTGRFRGLLTYVRADGTKFEGEVSTAVFTEPDGQRLTSMVIRDVTDRARMEHELRQSDARYKALLSGMHEGVAVYEPIDCGQDFVVLEFSPAAARIGRIAPARVIGRRVTEVLPGLVESGLLDTFRKVWATGTPAYLQAFPYRDGHIQGWRDSYVYRLPSGEVVAVFRDVTDAGLQEAEIKRSRDELRALAKHVVTAREDERQRVARDIHDELGQILTGIKLGLHALVAPERNRAPRKARPNFPRPAEPFDLPREIARLTEMVDAAIESVRTIIASLRPAMLDDLGIVPAMEWLVRDFGERHGIRSQFSGPEGDVGLDHERSITVYRMLQEALTNVARHAGAASVHVSFREDPLRFVLEVRDDGRGIGETEPPAGRCFGLVGMRERAISIGGAADISGAPGQGTNVVVTFPKGAPR